MAENPGPLSLESRRLQAVVKTCAERKLPLFAFCHDIGQEDLVQEGLAAVSRAAEKFNPAAGHWSTFVYTVASRRMLDLWRSRSRQAARDQAGARRLVTSDPAAEDLVDWCHRVRAAAHAIYGNKQHNVGPRWYRLPQIATLILLGNLRPEGLRWLLGQRKDLLRAIGLFSVPPMRMFEDAEKLLRKAMPEVDEPAADEPGEPGFSPVKQAIGPPPVAEAVA